MAKANLYAYLVERTADRKKFVMFGNPNAAWYRFSMFELNPEGEKWTSSCPYGEYRHISEDFYYDRKKFHILHQTAGKIVKGKMIF